MSKTKDNIIPLYRFINHIYSVNYSAQRIYDQSKKANADETAAFSQNWTSSKINDVAEARTNFLTIFSNAKKQSLENLDKLKEQLELSSSNFLKLVNFYYGKQLTFDELFDGFVCKEKNLAELINQFESQIYIAEDQDTLNFVASYAYYIDCLFSSMLSNTTIDIVDQLSQDINNNGVPAFYKGIINNPNVMKLQTSDLKNLMEKTVKYANELHKIKPPKEKDKTNFNISYNKTAQKYYDLEFFINQLLYRHDSANTDSNDSTINKFVESTIDFISGTKKEQPYVSEIYVSKLEMNYISYLQNILDYAIPKLKAMSASNKQKEQ